MSNQKPSALVSWLKQFNWVDKSFTILAVLIAAGFIAVQSGLYTTSSQVIEGEAVIEYVVLLRNIKTLDPKSLLKTGDKLALTIRNQPRGKVEVVAFNTKPKQIVLPKNDGNFALIPDPDDRYGYDYLVKFTDHAQLTSDGYVANGIKIKTGMKITVEGFDFQVPGVIVAVGRKLSKAEQEAQALSQPAQPTTTAPKATKK